MKRGLSKAERERREQQRAESELIKGVTAKVLKDLEAAPGTNVNSVWGAAYYQFINNGGTHWVSWSNQTALPTSPSLSPYSSNATTVVALPQFLNTFPSPSWSPSPPKSKLPRRSVDTPVIGYRSWHVDFPSESRVELRPTGVGGSWRGTVERARCNTARNLLAKHNPSIKRHQAPHEGCTCGIHAYKQLRDIGQGGGELWGAVLTWGKHVEHGDEGYRAAKARVIAFTIPPLIGTLLRDGRPMDYKTWAIRELLAKLAGDRLGVPVVPFDKLECYAKEFGEPLA